MSSTVTDAHKFNVCAANSQLRIDIEFHIGIIARYI